ncbi:hypothetical protein [Paenibacillus sp. FSL R7-0331]|uniref:hypothetical protein n=1 Tax=Paenibacillus sp. FSL R7-0331 TaxID=1536773 RepID=UPI0004F8B6E6|nr:hypothetical protein [Paenibacillus sp. FSL R7-0331]AIQ54546.1 hypothetical protein R70331_25530 [Paenibacillus sp. FSL R7-0331]
MEFELSNDSLMKALPALLGAYPSVARALKAYFDELVKVGFSEAQALHIISVQGVMGGLNGGNGN